MVKLNVALFSTFFPDLDKSRQNVATKMYSFRRSESHFLRGVSKFLVVLFTFIPGS